MEINFKALGESELLAIIEHPDNRGTVIGAQAKFELESRALAIEEIYRLAIAINESIAYKRITGQDLTDNNVSMHESHFLDKDEIRQIYIEQLEKYIMYKDQFRFDVWSYAIGGI